MVLAWRPEAEAKKCALVAGRPLARALTPTLYIPVPTFVFVSHELEKEIMQGTMPVARRRGRPRTAWMDNIKTWTGLPVEESIRMTEDRDKRRKYVNGVANPRVDDG